MSKTSPTPQLDRLIAQEPDLVDRIFEYLLAEIPQLAEDARLDEARRAVREEFASQQAYIRAQPLSDQTRLAQSVLALFNGRNATEVARRLNISRATVYRKLKQAGVKKPSQVSWK